MQEYSWSAFFQNEWSLKASRMISLDQDTKEGILRHFPKLNRAEIVDVGCGTGLFTECLTDYYRDSSICGIDLDEELIKVACERARGFTNKTIKYMVGDGMNLPFEDNRFDLTASHTYLTSLPDPEGGLHEMIRVTRPGGYVASISAQSFTTQTFSPGNYKKANGKTYLRYITLRKKIEEMYMRQYPHNFYINACSAERIPQIFGLSGLQHIAMYPIGYAFSLSDSRITIERKKSYILSFIKGEDLKLKAYENAGLIDISQDEVDEYRQLLSIHRQLLLDSLGENTVWEWIAGLNILMLGRKPYWMCK